MVISSLYKTAKKQGLDQRVTVEDFILLDDIHLNNEELIHSDNRADKIVNTPLNMIRKEDIEYIKNLV